MGRFDSQLYAAIRTALFAAGPKVLTEVVVVKPNGTRMHVKFGPSRELATCGVRGGPVDNSRFAKTAPGGRPSRPSPTPPCAGRRATGGGEAGVPLSTPCRGSGRRTRRMSPARQLKQRRRLSALIITHWFQLRSRWTRLRKLVDSTKAAVAASSAVAALDGPSSAVRPTPSSSAIVPDRNVSGPIEKKTGGAVVSPSSLSPARAAAVAAPSAPPSSTRRADAFARAAGLAPAPSPTRPRCAAVATQKQPRRGSKPTT